MGKPASAYQRNEDGLAAVEFALIAPFLVLMVVGIVDYGRYINQRMALENMSRAAAEYVIKGGNEANVMQDVVLASGTIPMDEISQVQFESRNVCECSDGEEVACGSTCSDGYERRYYQFSATRSYTPMFSYPGFPESMSIRGDSKLRTQ